METVAVHVINDHLVVSLTKLPGFGKLGTCKVGTSDANVYVDIYYSGGFFKRTPEPHEVAELTQRLRKLSENRVAKTHKDVNVKRIFFTSTIRGELGHEHQI